VDPRMFISYRSEDTPGYDALLYNELTHRFGKHLVFLDSESIEPGVDFVDELVARVRSARVVLVVIGRQWLTIKDESGRRRIDDPADWVRRELVEAFASNARVIPVLTDQATMPSEAELPADIAALSRCQARHLRHRDSSADLERLVTELKKQDSILAEAAQQQQSTGATRAVDAPPVRVGTPLAALSCPAANSESIIVQASGERAVAVQHNFGTITTGDTRPEAPQ
jgi:TIR domain-containing protein